ncbi:tetratricopeptide repeat protein [Alysiella filiformis]|uniref:Sel1 repeat-containing protein n=1 Tax=Alysiella filiformis DSM 16848 TaxID=1120981 RepID=A0A286E8W1_9NEIS|nr:tetratricopeptide repeat protein [Alysiella filiformis]UBQ56965.1 sel1 repeat family protein [Alysiella filiformis DSM 16848]SOD67320.1 Sel1 repeat-containing protein [Alysiella filiformis DSM 16848]
MENQTDLGMIAYEQGDFATAFAEWTKLSENGNAQAHHNLAMLYENGQGVAENLDLAKQFCQKAAELGLANAQYHLGYMLLGSDPKAALDWWEQAAQQGLAEAQHDLAQQYLLGENVAQDLDLAADWYEAAAQQNHTPSQFNLGVLYANVQQYANARYWWEKAAALNSEDAIAALQKLNEMNA